MCWIFRSYVLALCLLLPSSTLLLGQATSLTNDYLNANFSQLGYRIGHQKSLIKEFDNLKGNIKSLTQDAYDNAYNFLNHEDPTINSYRYVFDENHKILEYWLYENRDQPVVKEIYHDFLNQKMKFYMKFVSRGRMEFSTTFKYNNRMICTGTKTTRGDELLTSRYDLLKSGDTTIVASSQGHELYLSGDLIERASNNFKRTELFKYFEDGSLREWRLFVDDYLTEVMEFDTAGLIIESQSFTEGEKVLDRNSHLILYTYNDQNLVLHETHRLSDTRIDDYKIDYLYDSHKILKEKHIYNDSKSAKFIYSYNEHQDVVSISDDNGQLLSSIKYDQYDETNNWLSKLVTEKGKTFRYKRRIEYRND